MHIISHAYCVFDNGSSEVLKRTMYVCEQQSRSWAMHVGTIQDRDMTQDVLT